MVIAVVEVLGFGILLCFSHCGDLVRMNCFHEWFVLQMALCPFRLDPVQVSVDALKVSCEFPQLYLGPGSIVYLINMTWISIIVVVVSIYALVAPLLPRSYPHLYNFKTNLCQYFRDAGVGARRRKPRRYPPIDFIGNNYSRSGRQDASRVRLMVFH